MVEDIRVLVVDGGPGLAHGLICGLPGDGVSVLGPVADATAALRALELEPINLVLVDLDRPDDDGIEIVRRIRESADRTRVIGVTVRTWAGSGRRGARRRSLRCRDSRAQRREPRLGVPSGARRRAHPSRDPPSNLVDRLRDGREASTVCKLEFLTTRELEILRALADGASTAEIAASLGIRPMTVQSHVKNILSKLGVHSKVEAVTLAWRFGLGSVIRSA